MTPINQQIIQLLTKYETPECEDEVFDRMYEYLMTITHIHFYSVIVLLKRFPQQ